MGRIGRTDWLPVRGDPEHEQPDMSALSLSSGSDEPNSSDMENARPLHHRRPSFSEDDDSENELLERLAQRPPQYDIDEEAVLVGEHLWRISMRLTKWTLEDCSIEPMTSMKKRC